MIRRVLTLLAVVTVLMACDPLGRPTLEAAFGARASDGKLHFWTGSTCHDVIELGLTFDAYKQDTRAELAMTAPKPGVDVERFTLGQPVPGLTVTTPLPANFEWQKAEAVRINVDGSGELGGWGTTTELAEVIENSASHPDDTYWFQGVGWLNPGEVAEQDGKTFLATCTSEPPK